MVTAGEITNDEDTMMHLGESDFIAAMCDHKWYVSNVIEAPTHEREVPVSFMAQARQVQMVLCAFTC